VGIDLCIPFSPLAAEIAIPRLGAWAGTVVGEASNLVSAAGSWERLVPSSQAALAGMADSRICSIDTD